MAASTVLNEGRVPPAKPLPGRRFWTSYACKEPMRFCSVVGAAR
jgi:hypothetical protein